MVRKVPLVFSPQPEGGFTVTSPVLPELVTEGDSLQEAYANVTDALAAVLELYAEQGRMLPESTKVPEQRAALRAEVVQRPATSSRACGTATSNILAVSSKPAHTAFS